jgi:hypothetical protein
MIWALSMRLLDAEYGSLGRNACDLLDIGCERKNPVAVNSGVAVRAFVLENGSEPVNDRVSEKGSVCVGLRVSLNDRLRVNGELGLGSTNELQQYTVETHHRPNGSMQV